MRTRGDTPELGVTYRCRACGSSYDERGGAIECFYGHTGRVREMVVTFINADA